VVLHGLQALDVVISEAAKYGVRLILSLVNNWKDAGGKNQYVQWAKQRGQRLNSEDDFFSNPVTKQYYKNHVKVRIINMLMHSQHFNYCHI